MKKIFTLLVLSTALTCADYTVTMAQKPKMEVSSIKRKGETVRFTLHSSKRFILGNNHYTLYIGGREMGQYEQMHQYLTFLIPTDEFNQLKDGEEMYLTYGRASSQSESLRMLARTSKRCWDLGQFEKNLLTK